MSAKPGFNALPQRAEEFLAEVTPLLGSTVRSSFNGRFVHEIATAKPKRDWLLKGAFLARTLCLIVGQAGCGKSFLMLDLAMTMALAVVDPTAPKEWFSRKIKPCGIAYIAAEGQEDFTIRVQAWLLAKGLPLNTRLPFYLIPQAVDMRTSGEATEKLIKECDDVAKVMKAEFGCELGVVVADTFNRMLAGGDDSKPEHVGSLIRNCDAIRQRTGAAVFAVHHTAKNSKTMDPRGHSSITADNDSEVFVTDTIEGAPHSWIIKRCKGGARGDKHEFRLRKAVVGRDDDGEEITSCTVAPGGTVGSNEAHMMSDVAEAMRTGKPNMTADGRYILLPNAQAAMRALNELTKRKNAEADRPMPPPGVRVPHGSTAVTQDEWFDEIMRSMPGYIEPNETNAAEVAKHRDKCRKARDAAGLKFVEKGLAGMDQGWVWRTHRRVAGIDRPEQDEFAPRASGPTPESLGMNEEDVNRMF